MLLRLVLTLQLWPVAEATGLAVSVSVVAVNDFFREWVQAVGRQGSMLQKCDPGSALLPICGPRHGPDAQGHGQFLQMMALLQLGCERDKPSPRGLQCLKEQTTLVALAPAIAVLLDLPPFWTTKSSTNTGQILRQACFTSGCSCSRARIASARTGTLDSCSATSGMLPLKSDPNARIVAVVRWGVYHGRQGLQLRGAHIRLRRATALARC